MAHSQSGTLKRRISFWRALFLDTTKERAEEHNASEVFRQFDNLSWSDTAGKQSRYLFHPLGVANAMLDVQIDDNGIVRAQFGRTNREQLPDVEKRGQITPLNLGQYEGLWTVSHMMIRPDGVMAWERTSEGPTEAGFKRYAKERCGGLIDDVILKKVPTTKFLDMIPRITEVRLFDIAVKRKLRAGIGKIDMSMSDVFKSSSQWAEFDEYSFRAVMKDKKKKGPILQPFWEGVSVFIKNRSLPKMLQRLRVSVRLGQELKTQMLDLLEAQLSTEVEVKRRAERSTNADPKDMFEKMTEAFEAFGDEIEKGWEFEEGEQTEPIRPDQQELS